VRYRGANEYERLTPIGGNRKWSSFTACGDDKRLVELRLLERASAAENLQFSRRLQIVALLRHPGVRRVLDVAVTHAPPFFVVEPRVGGTLLESLAGAPLSFNQTLQLGKRLAEVLDESHRHGIMVGKLSSDCILDRGSQDWMVDLTVDPDSSGEDITEELGKEVFQLCELLRTLLDSRRPGEVSAEFQQASLVFQQILDRGTCPNLLQRSTAAEVSSAITLQCASIEAQNESRVGKTMVTPYSDADLIEKTMAPVGPIAGLASDVVPETLGRFQIHERLGEGAVGAVFRATDVSNGDTVAIKILNSQLARNPVVVQRFSKEARMLARAESPYVANLLDSNSDQNFHFLAIEFVAGGALTSLIRGGQRLSESVCLRFLLDASKGLAAAHQQSIIHRDIKPDNILLTTAGVEFASQKSSASSPLVDSGQPLLKLSDFGLARADQQSDSLAITQSGAIIGTPLYMAPEQCRGLAADARSDIYSLGATLFHLLAGRPPFQGDNHIAVMNAHCNDPLPELSRLCPDVSDGCVSVVEKCLAKNADARYPDAAALQADLERLLHGESTSMQLHPAAPATNGQDVLEFSFTCDLSASPSQLWPYVSNTDRINYAMGLSAVTYTTRTDPVRGVERFAETRIAGQKMVWQEFPYEWIEGRCLSVLREFSVGPLLWYMNIVELLPASGGGTRLTQTFKAVPRNWLGRVLAKLELGRRIPNSFRRVYSQIDSHVLFNQDGATSSTADPFGISTAITSAGRARLHERIKRLKKHNLSPLALTVLEQFLEHASDLEVARIRPLIFAERFELKPKDVIDACLVGAQEGLLVLLWDILCPSCRIPADVQATLASLKDHAYCSSCDLRYEVDFANSVELIFRAHPDVRSSETKTYCIGGPAFSAHVVAQTRLAPGERFEMELMLTEGSYRLRGSQLPFVVDLRVSAATGVTRLEIPLLRPPIAGSISPLRQGTQVLSLHNNTRNEFQIRLERTAGRQMALTAAAAAAIPLFREMFPQEVLAPGQIVSVTNMTLLMAEVCDASLLYQQLGDGPAFGKIRSCLLKMEEAIRLAGGAVIKIVGEGIVATFSTSVSAVNAAAAILKSSKSDSLPHRLAVHRGSAMVTTINDRLDYFGETVHMTRMLLQSASAGEILITVRMLQQDDVAAAIQSEGLSVKTADFTVDHAASVLSRVS